MERRGDSSGRIRMVALPNFTATTMAALLKQNLNDAKRLAADPTFRMIGSPKLWDRDAALTSTLHWFETELLTREENLGNLWRRLVLPKRIDRWSLTSVQQRLVKTGGRLVKHARYYWLLLAESHLTRRLFGAMLRRIWALPVPAG